MSDLEDSTQEGYSLFANGQEIKDSFQSRYFSFPSLRFCSCGPIEYFLARWSQIQPLFPGRSCYALQNRWRKLMQYSQINKLFDCQQVSFFLFNPLPSNSFIL
jgi:hypothetical protein